MKKAFILILSVLLAASAYAADPVSGFGATDKLICDRGGEAAQIFPLSTMTTDGNLAVMWLTDKYVVANPFLGQPIATYDWVVQKFTPAGQPLYQPVRLTNIDLGKVGNIKNYASQVDKGIIAGRGGAVLALFQTYDSVNLQHLLKLRKIDGSGNLVGAATITSIPDGGGSFEQAQMVPDGVGGTFVFWIFANPTGDQFQILAKRYNENAQPYAGEIKVLYVSANKLGPLRVAADPNGGYYLAWQEPAGPVNNSNVIRAMRISSSAAPLWKINGADYATVLVDPNGAGNYTQTQIVSDPTGCIVGARCDNLTLNAYDFRAQRLNAADGAAAWTDEIPGSGNGKKVLTATFRDEFSIISDGLGGIIVGQMGYNNVSMFFESIRSERVAADGRFKFTSMGTGIDICRINDNIIAELQVVSDGKGGAYLAWSDARYNPIAAKAGLLGGNTTDIYAKRIDSAGQTVWGGTNGLAVTPVVGFQYSPAMAVDSAGGISLVFADSRQTASSTVLPSQFDIYGQSISAAGSPLLQANGILLNNDKGAVAHLMPATCGDGEKGAVAAWIDMRDGTPCIYVNRTTPRGELLWGPYGVRISGTDKFSLTPAICRASDGNFILAWSQMTGNPFAAPVPPPAGFAAGKTVNRKTLRAKVEGLAAADTMKTYAMKISKTNGATMWNQPTQMSYDYLGYGDYFPAVCADDNGGAIVAYSGIPGMILNAGIADQAGVGLSIQSFQMPSEQVAPKAARQLTLNSIIRDKVIAKADMSAIGTLVKRVDANGRVVSPWGYIDANGQNYSPWGSAEQYEQTPGVIAAFGMLPSLVNMGDGTIVMADADLLNLLFKAKAQAVVEPLGLNIRAMRMRISDGAYLSVDYEKMLKGDYSGGFGWALTGLRSGADYGGDSVVQIHGFPRLARYGTNQIALCFTELISNFSLDVETTTTSIYAQLHDLNKGAQWTPTDINGVLVAGPKVAKYQGPNEELVLMGDIMVFKNQESLVSWQDFKVLWPQMANVIGAGLSAKSEGVKAGAAAEVKVGAGVITPDIYPSNAVYLQRLSTAGQKKWASPYQLSKSTDGIKVWPVLANPEDGCSVIGFWQMSLYGVTSQSQ